jgi:hypothetical protein
MPVTTYWAMFAYFALMLSPILLVMAVALGHHVAAGIRRVNVARRNRRGASRRRVVWRIAQQES